MSLDLNSFIELWAGPNWLWVKRSGPKKPDLNEPKNYEPNPIYLSIKRAGPTG